MDILYITHALNGLLMVAMPIALGIYLTRKFRLGWRLWWIGAVTFILSQVGHIPFNAVFFGFLQKNLWLPQYEKVLYAVLAGLSAGIFEEGARYLVLRFWAKSDRSYRKGILFGAGHGGAEAILLGLLVLYGFINMAIARGMDLTQLVPADQLAAAQQQVQAYWSATWYDSLLGAVERSFSIPVQICLAVIVMRAFTHRQWWWLGLAVLWHAAVDAIAVLASQTWNPYVTEAIIGVMALVSVGIIFALREPEPPEPETAPPPELSPAPVVQPVEETTENVENTRYDPNR